LATDRETNRWTGLLHEAALAVTSGGLIMQIIYPTILCMAGNYSMIVRVMMTNRVASFYIRTVYMSIKSDTNQTG